MVDRPNTGGGEESQGIPSGTVIRHRGKCVKPASMSSAVAGFQQLLAKAKHICVLTGAGISAESGIPTFRGAGGLWRTYEATRLATPEAFKKNPGLVWEFYHYRREVVARCQPNDGHFALTALQRKLAASVPGRTLSIITQNIDRLHQASGSVNVTELHGSLWLVKPENHRGFIEEQGKVWEDRTMPLAPCFVGRCQPNPDVMASDIPREDLPHHSDGRLLRPAVVWFGEGLDSRVLGSAVDELERECDLMLAGLADMVAERGVPVVEVNLEATDNTGKCTYAFHGKSGELLPSLLGVRAEVEALKQELGFGPDKKEEEED